MSLIGLSPGLVCLRVQPGLARLASETESRNNGAKIQRSVIYEMRQGIWNTQTEKKESSNIKDFKTNLHDPLAHFRLHANMSVLRQMNV